MTKSNSKVIALAMQSEKRSTKKLTTSEFVEKAIAIHGLKYDYSLVKYNGSKAKVIIKCLIHGEFQQQPNCHLSGKGCWFCSGRKALTTKKFIERATVVHGSYYSYGKTIYKNSKMDVEIVCPKHGAFKQNPNHHLNGNGCNKCAYESKAKLLSSGKDGFVKLANKIHNSQYLYDKCIYVNNKTKVIITCKMHGDFLQKPDNHISKKSGCPKCVVRHFQRASYIEICAKHQGKSKLYILECISNDELFYKIGIAVNGVNKRYRSAQEMPYKYEILREIKFEAGLAWDLEKQIHRLLKKHKYTPKIYFAGGKTECFSIVPKDIFNLIDRVNKSDQLTLIT